MLNTLERLFKYGLLFNVAAQFCRLFKLFPVFAKFISWFNISQIILPILGYALPIDGLITAYALKTMLNVLGSGASAYYLLYHLPTFLASLSVKSSRITHLAAALSIILFVNHEVGYSVAWYSLFWLIPIICKSLGKNLFYDSLAATFTAHAVGTVIYLYTFETTSAFWITLAPRVIIERLIFATGIYLTICIYNFAKQFNSSINVKTLESTANETY